MATGIQVIIIKIKNPTVTVLLPDYRGNIQQSNRRNGRGNKYSSLNSWGSVWVWRGWIIALFSIQFILYASRLVRHSPPCKSTFSFKHYLAGIGGGYHNLL